jgi:fructoselysine-6-P-deglycase FrlB-like protein
MVRETSQNAHKSKVGVPVPHVDEEIASQPACWGLAVDLASRSADRLPAPGERVAVIGCGTSWFMAMAYAALREAAGHGETDAFAASQFPARRGYDRVLAITRSGTTTEVLDALSATGARTTAIVGDPDSPVAHRADDAVLLPFADEHSVVQTRFATSTLILLRSHLGEPVGTAPSEAAEAVRVRLPLDPGGIEQVSFLGTGWTVGLAHEAALKCREAATFWSEAYPAMEYRHGPITIAEPGRAVWAFGAVPDGLAKEVAATGATFVHSGHRDPLADLIVAQRFAVAVAIARGLDPDRPRHLTRSVILS